MTLQEFTIEFALRHKELPEDSLITNITPFLEEHEEQKVLTPYKGCFLKLLSELRASPSLILPVGFVIAVTEVYYIREKNEVGFNYRFDISGKDNCQYVSYHHFNSHPTKVLSSVFEIVPASKCSVMVASVRSVSEIGKRKYNYTADPKTLL